MDTFTQILKKSLGVQTICDSIRFLKAGPESVMSEALVGESFKDMLSVTYSSRKPPLTLTISCPPQIVAHNSVCVGGMLHVQTRAPNLYSSANPQD